jgi:hypothetical protein
MAVFNEALPLVGGILVGIFCGGVSPRRKRLALWLGLSLVVGFAVSWINGELAVGWEFLLFDIPLVAAAAFTVMLLRRVGRRALG